MKMTQKLVSVLLVLCMMLGCIMMANAETEDTVKLTVWCWSPNDELLQTGAEMVR